MKTWRERIAEARARGWFTHEDRKLSSDILTCAVGEAMARYGLGDSWANDRSGDHTTIEGAGLFQLAGIFPVEVLCNRFDDVERALDAIDDRALQLKREQA